MKRVFYFLMCITLALPMVSCGNKSSNTSSSYTSRYKSFGTAINDGSIYRGISYEKIKEICGNPDYISYGGGKIQYVYYGRYQVRLDRSGCYEYYNISSSY